MLENIPASIRELGELSDEIWALAGDTSVDTSWYTKRASLGAVYAATGIHHYSLHITDGSNTVSRTLHDPG